MTETVPNPGSPEAVGAGCTCAVLDNNRGRVAPHPPDGGCPLHDRRDETAT